MQITNLGSRRLEMLEERDKARAKRDIMLAAFAPSHNWIADFDPSYERQKYQMAQTKTSDLPIPGIRDIVEPVKKKFVSLPAGVKVRDNSTGRKFRAE